MAQKVCRGLLYYLVLFSIVVLSFSLQVKNCCYFSVFSSFCNSQILPASFPVYSLISDISAVTTAFSLFLYAQKFLHIFQLFHLLKLCNKFELSFCYRNFTTVLPILLQFSNDCCRFFKYIHLQGNKTQMKLCKK